MMVNVDDSYPLVISNIADIAIANGPVEIVSFPCLKRLMFHSYVNVYQRVDGDQESSDGSLTFHPS